jgi:hypothetical protein
MRELAAAMLQAAKSAALDAKFTACDPDKGVVLEVLRMLKGQVEDDGELYGYELGELIDEICTPTLTVPAKGA